MANLRIISDNAADRATLSASSTSGLLAVTSLQSDKKSSVWRATGKISESITGTWAVAETISCVALPFCNLSPTATIRVQLYDAVSAGTLLLDTNTLQPGALACPAPAITLRGWTAAQSASAYAYGGGAMARIWFAPTAGVKRMVVTIADANNVQGYIEAARLVCGPYWSPTYNTKSLSETYVDGATHYRTDAGDLMTDASTIHKKVPIEFEYMPASDRTQMANILRASRAYPIFLSVFPGDPDLELERAHTVYGKRMGDSEVAVQAAITYGTKIDVESV
jgi:hypothetical protein